MARPRHFDAPASDAIRVRVTPLQRRALEQVARQNRTDVSGVIRQAVNEYVSDYGERRVFRGTKR